MRDNFLVFGSPRIEEDEIEEVVSCLRSGWIGTGPRVAEFERRFAAYKGAEHSIAVNSCTAALHLSILAADIGPGDEVITTPMTFCASVNAIIHAGATPVLADIDPRSMNIDPEKVRAKITPRTKAILPVHFAGRSCDMDPLCAMADEHGLTIIEDCAHAIETEYRGRKAGTFGDFGCFSFYVTKNVITGSVVETSYNPTAKFPQAFIERREVTYSYEDGDLYHFMDVETYDDIPVGAADVPDNFKFCKENDTCKLLSYKGKVFSVEIPNFVELEVTATEPGVKGNTATNTLKPATVETGAEIRVPLFINEGDKIRIDTRTGEYMERVN